MQREGCRDFNIQPVIPLNLLDQLTKCKNKLLMFIIKWFNSGTTKYGR